MSAAYEADKTRYSKYLTVKVDRSGQQEEIRTTPLFSLRVKHAVDPVVDKCKDEIVSNGSATQSSSDHDQDSEVSGSTVSISSSSGSASSSLPGIARRQRAVLPQYALLGHHIGDLPGVGRDEPILLNVDAPNSTFIVGSQGSGKSYTLSCMLENCLLSNHDTGRVRTPVAGVVFHYDVDSTSSIAEAAHLCSRGIKVDVLISPSNERALSEAYKAIDTQGNLEVRPLMLRSSDLSVERMHKLMALAEKDGPVPLYIEVLQRILRQMAVAGDFDYGVFKETLCNETLTRDQTGPLGLRLGLLESFMDPRDIPSNDLHRPAKHKRASASARATNKEKLFNLQPGSLTIIDLSDTFVDPSTVCLLFDICLGMIKEQRPGPGLVVALDEAHRFMNKSKGADHFTERLLTTIREQRHNGTRVIIATQEPTISERLLDLSSVSIVHRFTSPAWFASIRDHLSGASKMVSSDEERNEMFERIVGLNVGESLVFSPSAFVVVEEGESGKLGAIGMKMKTRARLGTDGGVSMLASAPHFTV